MPGVALDRKPVYGKRQQTLLFDREKIQSVFVDHFQNSTTATRDTGEWIFGNYYR
jgi:hypothetical protein